LVRVSRYPLARSDAGELAAGMRQYIAGYVSPVSARGARGTGGAGGAGG
jgi:hypothetical protein